MPRTSGVFTPKTRPMPARQLQAQLPEMPDPLLFSGIQRTDESRDALRRPTHALHRSRLRHPPHDKRTEKPRGCIKLNLIQPLAVDLEDFPTIIFSVLVLSLTVGRTVCHDRPSEPTLNLFREGVLPACVLFYTESGVDLIIGDRIDTVRNLKVGNSPVNFRIRD